MAIVLAIAQVIGLLLTVLYGTSILAKIGLKATIDSSHVVLLAVGFVLFFFTRYGF